MKIGEKVLKNQVVLGFTIFLMTITQIFCPLVFNLSQNTSKLYKTKLNKKEELIWKIEIPKINLNAEIKDGIDQDNLNKYVGHFTESGYISGNVCLAAHNRGYKVNYFQNLKELEIGDKIIYQYKNVKLVYIVKVIKIIKDTDIDVIKPTKENKITLITCVENKPELRRCIQGILKI